MPMYKEVADLVEVEGDTLVRGQVASRARLGNGLSICNLSMLRFFQIVLSTHFPRFQF